MINVDVFETSIKSSCTMAAARPREVPNHEILD